MRIYVEAPDLASVPETLLEEAVRETFRAEDIQDGEVTLVLLGDEPIRELNLRWLDHDWVPDVLTFPLHDKGEAPSGDVYIGVDQAGRQAGEAGIRPEEELVRLAIHGTLHLLGYDHPEAAEARADSEHYQKQEAILTGVMRKAGDGRGADSLR